MLRLRGTFSHNPRLAPLLDGTVQPKGIELDFEIGHPVLLHERHLRENDCDVFEFSISHYMLSRQQPNGRWDWTALPIFLTKALMWQRAYAHVGSGVAAPADLKGKRFGLPDFTMTAGLWFRAMLRHLYGYRAADNQWFVGRTPEHSHAALLGMGDSQPRGVQVTWLREEGALNAMLRRGEIDAAYGAGSETPVTGDSPDVRPLFPDDGRAFTEDFARSTGFGPVNHTVIIQRRIVDENPWVPQALLDAFEQAKQEAYRRDPTARTLFPDQDPADQRVVFGDDPYPLGLAANRAMLRMAAEQSVDDGLAPEVIDVDTLFHESVRGS